MIKDLNITSVNVDKSTDSLNKLGKEVDKTASSLNKLNNSVQDVNSKMNSFKSIVDTFNNSFKDTNITVDQARQAINKFNNDLSSLNSASNTISTNNKNIANSYTGITSSLNGVGTSLGTTSQSLLSTNNGFINASDVSKSLSGSLNIVGMAGINAASSMANAGAGIGTYTASAIGATGSTLTLEEGITKLVDIMSKEADITTKVTDQLKIRREVLSTDNKAIKERIDSTRLSIQEAKDEIALAEKGIETYKKRGLSTKNYEKTILNANKQINKLSKEEDNLQKELEESNSRIFQVNSTLTRYSQSHRQAATSLGNTTQSINENTTAITNNGRNLGSGQRQWSSFSSVLGRAFQWFSAYAIVSKFFGIIKDGINVIKDFSKEVSRLSAITGLPKASEEMKLLEDQAIALGKATEYTSKQIVELQIELAKLGLRSSDILASTKSVSAGATAMGSSLAETAKLGATTMKAFGLQANNMDQIMGALAKSTTKSALSFEYLTTALPYAATAGSALGFQLEDVLALLSALSDSGFKASQAGTGLRNIFSKLADETKKLGKELGPIRNLDDLLNAFEDLSKAGVDLGKAFELTDARAMNQFLTLVKNRKAIKGLAEEYKNTAGVLDEMREKQLDNLAGSITLLTSAWDGLMLKFSKSEGVLKKTVDLFRALVNYAGDLVGGTEGQIQEEISAKVESTTRVLGQVTKELEAKYKADVKVLELAKQMSKDKGITEAQAINIIAINKAREASSTSMLESLNEELIKEQELLNTVELRIQGAKELDKAGQTPSQKKLDELEAERIKRQGVVDSINASIKATKEFAKIQEETPLKAPTAVTGGGDVDKMKEEAAKIAEQQRRDSIGQLARLKEDYEARKALLEKYGESTVHLTFNYEQQVKAITDKAAADSLKVTQDKIKEQERLEKESKKKRYDEALDVINEEANSEIIKWNKLLNANKVGSLAYENEMININLKRLQDEYDFLSKSENQTEESEKRKTEIIKEQLEERKKLNSINLEIAQEGMTALAGIMGGASKLAKENSKAQKALAISEVVVNTVSGGIAAVKKSIDTFGMPAGPIIGGAQAASLALSGAAAIKQIKNADKGGNLDNAAQAIAPPPISMTRNVLGQEDIQLQKEIMGDVSPVVRVVDIEKGLSKSSTRVSESSF